MPSKYTITKIGSDFPPLLKEIADPPALLYAEGLPLDPKAIYFAIVGTRRPSPYGCRMAEEFGFALAQQGFTIVSGLAYGIDGIAHEAALQAKGKTIAVLGSGLNNITPTCNRKLAERISQTGTIVTEYSPDIPPQKFTFPARNRIIAGMSIATLVIEAPEKSGALITAEFALEYNRDVFAIPGNITQETSRGGNRLIQKGLAFPVMGMEDIITYLELQNVTQTDKIPRPLLSPNEELILSLLKRTPLSIDHIMAESKLSAAEINTTLSLLELKKRIKITGVQAEITR